MSPRHAPESVPALHRNGPPRCAGISPRLAPESAPVYARNTHMDANRNLLGATGRIPMISATATGGSFQIIPAE
jgi:hypothetical protein